MNESYEKILNDKSLSVQEKMDNLFEPAWDSYFNEQMEYHAYQVPENADESLDYLISLFTDKNSKRLRYAGKYLKKAFLEAPPVEQRKIGLALLTGNKVDTEWVCKNLGDFSLSYKEESIIRWHPCYEEAIEQCWEKYHGENCGKLIIQFFDEEKIRPRIDEFETEKLYFWLCRRFVTKDWFKVNAKYLKRCFISINSYLFIMSKTSDGISDDEAEELLYKWVGCVASLYMRNNIEDVFIPRFSLVEQHHVMKAWGIDDAIFYLLKMGKEDVVSRFISWGNLVRKEFDKIFFNKYGLESSKEAALKFCLTVLNNFPPKYEYLTRLNFMEYTFKVGRTQPLVEPTTRHYPVFSPYLSTSEYKHYVHNNPSFRCLSEDEEYKMIIEKNPSIQELIDKLGLEVSKNEEETEKEANNYDVYDDVPF